MKGDNTYVQNQYGQDQVHAQQQAPVYNDTSRGYQQQQPQAYGAVGNMGAPHHQQQPHVVGGAHGSVQPIYVVDGQRPGSENFALDIVLYIVALFLPPASVVVKRGCGGQFWLNVILSILGFIPGCIHAFYIIAVTPGTYSKEVRRR